MTTDGKSGLVRLEEIGAWEGPDGLRGTTVLASLQETDAPKLAEAAAAAGVPVRHGWGWSVTTVLLGAVLGLMLLESWLFHRQAVY